MHVLNTEKDFLSNRDYLLSLSKEVEKKEIDNFDSNLVYEIAYANMYLSDLISKTEDCNFCKELVAINSIFDGVLARIPSADVLKARETIDYKNVLANKYSSNKSEDGSYEKVYERMSQNSAIVEYIKAKITPIIIMGLSLLLLLSGLIPKSVGLVSDILSPSVSSESGSTTEISEDKKDSSIAEGLFAEELSGSPDAIKDSLTPIISTVTALLALVLIMFFTLSTIIDVAYMSLPFVAAFLDQRDANTEVKIVSKFAKQALEQQNDGSFVKYGKIKDYNRIDRNKYWLESMLSLTEGKTEFTSIHSRLLTVKEVLDTTKEFSKEYYLNVAKVEFLHDDYLRVVGNYAC